LIDSGLVRRKVFFGEVSRGKKILYSETDPESYITEYTLVYEEYPWQSEVEDQAAERLEERFKSVKVDRFAPQTQHVNLIIVGQRAPGIPDGGRCAEIGVLLPNNQRQHRTLHIQKDVLPYALC